MRQYNLYIESYSRRTKLYWNRLLRAWVENKGSASPFDEKEILSTEFTKFQRSISGKVEDTSGSILKDQIEKGY